MKNRPDTDSVERRRAVVARLNSKTALPLPQNQAELRRLQHQLEVHEIELEMQNTELRTAQAEMEAGLERYTDLYDFAPVGYFNLSGDGVIQIANLTGAKLVGIERSELVGRRFAMFLLETDRPAFNTFFEQVFAAKDRQFCDVGLLTNSASSPMVRLKATLAPDGKECRLAMWDITEGKRAEATMVASEARYRRLFEAAKDGILILNPTTGRIVDVNPYLTDLLGFSRGNFVGKQLWELGSFKDIAASQTHFKELQAKDYIRYRDLPLTTSDGRRIDVEFVSNAYIVDGHRVMQCNIRDITERKRVEESNARLAQAVAQAAETIVITDTKGTILYTNPAFEKTSGYTCAEAVGQNPRILKSGKQDATFYNQMWDTLNCGKVWEGHFSNRRKDGKLYEEEASISPIRGAIGKVVSYVAVKRDVTREVQLESQFRQSQKMEAIGTLAGGVAHDFNNILACIQMQIELLKGDSSLSTGQKRLADDIVVSVKRAVGLTRQLLLFSRKEVRQPRDLDLNLSVNELTKMLTRILGENITVRLRLAAQSMFVHADAGMMDQVLMNLAVNARDAMVDGGQMVIETAGVEFDKFAAMQTAQARPGSFVCLSVSDNGCGIPPENLSRIFEPFFTTKEVGKGTGLGLATVFAIAEQHNGWVNVDSEVNHGTTFKVYLPRLAEAHGAKFINKTPATAQTGHETILLVEDEPTLRNVMGIALTRLGYRVLEAPTGFQALEVAKKHSAEIHLLLTDLMMPDGMTGKELGHRLLQENPKLKVIYMSGYSADLAAKDFPLQEGVNFLIKPFQVQRLAQTIRQNMDAPVVES